MTCALFVFGFKHFENCSQAAFVAVFLFSAPANAQSTCNKRDFIVSQLETLFQEYPKAIGLAGNGNVVELFVSDSGSWTLLLSLPGGTSCLIASGESWETIPIPLKGRAA